MNRWGWYSEARYPDAIQAWRSRRMWIPIGGGATVPFPEPRWMPCANTTSPPLQLAGTSMR